MNKIKSIFKFILLVSLAGGLLWLSLGSLQVQEGETRWGFIVNVWNSAHKPYLLLSAIATVLSHVFRSERWKLMMNPLGYPLKSTYGFYSVMIGYFVNLGIPRGGEISRCYNLYKLNSTPLDQSLGTVVAERIIDLFFLLSAILIGFLMELDNLLDFFSQLDYSSDNNKQGSVKFYLSLLAGFGFLLVILFLLLKKKYRFGYIRLLSKFRKTLKGLKKGLVVVFNLENKVLFVVYSLGIWVMYFLMMYTIILAFPETHHLSVLDSITIFAIGGIAMAIPLPGGTGSYHVLVPLGLVMLYGIQQKEAIAFSFIFHGWQTLMIIFLGIISLLGSQWYIRLRKNELSK